MKNWLIKFTAVALVLIGAGWCALVSADPHCYLECVQLQGGATHNGNVNEDDTWVCCDPSLPQPSNPVSQQRCTSEQMQNGFYSCSKSKVDVVPGQNHDANCTGVHNDGPKACDKVDVTGQRLDFNKCEGGEDGWCSYVAVFDIDGNPLLVTTKTKVCVDC